jgi:hypothetical protein
MFDIPIFSRLANEGAIFDPEGNLNMVASIVQTILTTVANKQFAKVAKRTAKMENHKTQSRYETSVFLKRFIFEFTDF